MNRLKTIIREIHRRSLWQVTGIFLAASWGVLQVIETLTDTAGLPDWTPTMALVILLLGLPVCLATAFVQEGIHGPDDSEGARPEPDPDAVPTEGASPQGWTECLWRTSLRAQAFSIGRRRGPRPRAAY